MSMASLNASLLARKGTAQPAGSGHRHLTPVPTMETVGKSTYETEKKTQKKYFRLGSRADRDLKLLAVREGLSQQILMERAMAEFLDRAFAKADCICRQR